MREETLNPMQEAIAFGRVIPGAAAEGSTVGECAEPLREDSER